MKLLHRMLLKLLPGPFLACMGTLMFLLLMQFLMRHLPDIVGKGLPFGVIIELITYNLAYMVVLAVPMSILIATTMACGRLAESQTYTAIKNAGISFPRLIWPVCMAGGLLMIGMLYFNNIILPEANYRAKNLWMDIRRKQPGIELEPGVFYSGLPGYSLRAAAIDADDNVLHDVLIFKETESRPEKTTITAERGRLQTLRNGRLLELTLFDGELHRLETSALDTDDRQYERLTFARYKIQVDISDLLFNRRSLVDAARSDRTMRTGAMIQLVDSLETLIAERRAKMQHMMVPLKRSMTDDKQPAVHAVSYRDTAAFSSRATASLPLALRGLQGGERRRIYRTALQQVRRQSSDLANVHNTLSWYRQEADQYLVEIHKKFSIAVACIIFVLVGAPLGLAVRRGSISVAGGLSAGIFLFYWVTLVQGEKLADRGYLEPWIGMWAANLVVGVIGIGLSVLLTLDRTSPETFQRLVHKVRGLLRRL